jgi:hypothetical protein
MGKQPSHPASVSATLPYFYYACSLFSPPQYLRKFLNTYGVRTQNDLVLCFIPGLFQLLLALLPPILILSLFNLSCYRPASSSRLFLELIDRIAPILSPLSRLPR